ncbi:MAG: selenocysteine-specific translation elongation factor [Verrucomicrobiota bacterium]
MTVQHFIIATAGHVDHGKSALVKALTGTDPDRLPEEKARGITIDLGFAHLDLPAPASTQPPTLFRLGIVDVPGHEDFVKNMVAGVGSIDLALFIVAADDGWMPQTEEHLQILTYLGVRRAIVALTKIDLVESDELEVVEGIRTRLENTVFADAPIVPTSVINSRGIAELKSTLSGLLAATPPPRDIGKPRLPVDRVFVLRGIGTVVTGTLNGGTLRRGQSVVAQPGALAGKIRSLQSHNEDVDASGPGTRTAINLPDLASRSELESAGIGRGDVITLSELGTPSNTLDVVLEKSGRLQDVKSPAARPLKDGALVRVHHGSANFSARVILIGSEPLQPGGRVFAQLRSETPVFAFAGDHFIVRDWAEQYTLGGGVILEPDANRRSFRGEKHRQFLEKRAAAPEDCATFVATRLDRDGAARRTGLLTKSRFSTSEINDAIAQLMKEGRTRVMGDWVAETGWWTRLRQRAMDAIDQEHRQRPQHVGLALSDLRRVMEPHLPASELFDLLAADLCQFGFSQVGVAIRRDTHRPALPPQLQAAGQRLRGALSTKPFEPPSKKELAPDQVSQQALRFLLQTGEAVEVGEEVVLLNDNFSKAVEIVKKYLRDHGSATVSELRQAVGASRRIMVPLLEKLDKEGVTRRDGDKRFLRKS